VVDLPLSPVQRARKFSAVLGTTELKSMKLIRPEGLPPMLVSNHTRVLPLASWASFSGTLDRFDMSRWLPNIFHSLKRKKMIIITALGVISGIQLLTSGLLAAAVGKSMRKSVAAYSRDCGDEIIVW